PTRPRVLDLDPARTLPAHPARVVALMRAVLAEPEALGPRNLPGLVRRLASRQSPAAPRRVEIEARDLLAGWLATGMARDLSRAGRVLRPRTWAGPWPPDGRDA